MSIADKFNIPQSLFETIVKMNKESAEYQAKVKALMAKKGIKSLGDLSPEQKKEFFNTLDAMHKAKNEEVELDEAIPKSTGHALVHSSSKKIIAKGNKEEMMKKMKELNAKEKGSHYLGMTNRGKVGDTFGEEVELEEGYEKVVLDFLDKKGFDSPYFKSGDLYVSKRELAGVKKALQNPTGFNADDLKVIAEEIELEESKSSTGYNLYHKDFSSAMAHAYDFAKKKYGIEVDPEEIDRKVAMGPKRPSSGKTNSYRLMGKGGKKAIQVQVANLDDKRYELNMYKEEVELDEEKMYYSLVHKMTKKVKSTHTNLDSAKEEHRSMEPGVRAHFYVATSTKNPMKEEQELEEGMSSAQVAKLRQEYEKIDKIDPASDNYKKLTAMLDKLDTKTLQQLAGAKIKFVSGLAQNRIVRRMNEEQELTESHFKVGDEVECIASGMEGEVVKLDEPQTGKYYTVKREDGKMVKYAPDELRLADDEDEEDEKDEMDEASSPAQQAAIAIAMKKAGKKPKDMEEETEAMKDFMVKFEKEGKVSVKTYTAKSELDAESKAKVDAKRMGMRVASVRLKEDFDISEAEGGGTTVSATDQAKSQAERAKLTLQSAMLRMKHAKEREALQKKKQGIKEEFDLEEAKKFGYEKYRETSVKVTGKTPEQRTKEIEDIQAKLKQQKAEFEARHAKKSMKEGVVSKIIEAYKKKKMKETTAADNAKSVKAGEKLSGKSEPIVIDPEMK